MLTDASISVSVGPEANPFANLGGGESDQDPGGRLKPAAPVAERPFAWLIGTAVAFLALVGLMVGAVFLFLNQQAGSLPRPGRTALPEKPSSVAATPTETPTDFPAAEYALSLGGTVCVQGVERDLKNVRELPQEPFRLTTVDLTALPIRDLDLAPFRDCTELSILSLARTKVTDAGLAHLRGCNDLILLGVENTSVTDIALKYVRECRQLQTLDVRNTAVARAGLEAFQAAVPGCKIIHDGGILEPRK